MQYAEDYTQRISIFESGIGRIKKPSHYTGQYREQQCKRSLLNIAEQNRLILLEEVFKIEEILRSPAFKMQMPKGAKYKKEFREPKKR